MIRVILALFTLLPIVQNNCIQNTFTDTEIRVCSNGENCVYREISGCATPDNIPPNANQIHIISNLKYLKRNAFQNIPRLKIECSNITLEEIYPGCFFNLQEADRISAPYNSISKVCYGVFTSTTFLSINLGYNRISEIEEATFGYMPRLVAIVLKHNQLTEIGSYWFTGSENIVVIELSWNFITHIKSNAFDGIKSLKWLHLGYNQIQTIEHNVFNGFEVGYLFMEQNNLAEINATSFGRNVVKHWLSLGGNRITYLSNTFLAKVVRNGMTMDIYRNPLSCGCLKHIEKWSADNQVKLYMYPEHKFKGHAPICVTTEKDELLNPELLCNYTSARNNKEHIQTYLSVMKNFYYELWYAIDFVTIINKQN